MKLLKLHPRVGRVDNDTIEEFAMVDDEDYEELLSYTWFYKVDNAGDPEKRHISVSRNPIKYMDDVGGYRRKSLVMLSHHILGLHEKGYQVRHKDKNPLNCQKDNLLLTLDGHKIRRLRESWLSRVKIVPQIER